MKSDKNTYSRSQLQEIIFITCDPAAGGTKSKFSIMSGFVGGVKFNEIVIIGADAVNWKTPTYLYQILVEHIKKIRTFDEFKNSKIVFIPENNLGNEAFHIINYVRDQCGIEIIDFYGHEDGNDLKNGIHMDENLKGGLARHLSVFIDNQRIHYYSEFFTLTPGKTAETMKNEIHEQLVGFSKIILSPKGDSNIIKVKYSGKSGPGFDDQGINFHKIYFFC